MRKKKKSGQAFANRMGKKKKMRGDVATSGEEREIGF